MYSAKRKNILASLETLAQNLSRDIYQAVLSVTGETTNSIAKVTTGLVEDEDQNIGLSFVTVQKRSRKIMLNGPILKA